MEILSSEVYEPPSRNEWLVLRTLLIQVSRARAENVQEIRLALQNFHRMILVCNKGASFPRMAKSHIHESTVDRSQWTLAMTLSSLQSLVTDDDHLQQLAVCFQLL